MLVFYVLSGAFTGVARGPLCRKWGSFGGKSFSLGERYFCRFYVGIMVLHKTG